MRAEIKSVAQSEDGKEVLYRVYLYRGFVASTIRIKLPIESATDLTKIAQAVKKEYEKVPVESRLKEHALSKQMLGLAFYVQTYEDPPEEEV